MSRANDYIQHYGIKGMKWGVRRYQNKDGTLTAEGKKREQAKYKHEASKAARKDRRDAYKNRRTLSDDELQTRVKRLELEKKFKNLTEEDVKPGRIAVKRLLSSTGARILSAAAVGGAVYAGRYALTGKFDTEEAANYIFPNPNRKK